MSNLALDWRKCPAECIKVFKKLPNYASWHIFPVYNIYKYAIKDYQIYTFTFIRSCPELPFQE